MESETTFGAIFVAWYTTSCTDGFVKVGILHDFCNCKLLDLGFQRRVRFETGIPIWILNA